FSDASVRWRSAQGARGAHGIADSARYSSALLRRRVGHAAGCDPAGARARYRGSRRRTHPTALEQWLEEPLAAARRRGGERRSAAGRSQLLPQLLPAAARAATLEPGSARRLASDAAVSDRRLE